jgi:hypothetical protein
LPPSDELLNRDLKCLKYLGIDHVDSLATALERHKNHIDAGERRCDEVDYGPDTVCAGPSERGWAIWMLIQLLCAEKATLAETLEAFGKIDLWIADSMESYAESLRTIVRRSMPNPDTIKASDYGSVYVTFMDEAGSSNSVPLRLVGDKWIWENISVTAQHVIVDGLRYDLASKSPLYADIIHKGKRLVVTE